MNSNSSESRRQSRSQGVPRSVAVALAPPVCEVGDSDDGMSLDLPFVPTDTSDEIEGVEHLSSVVSGTQNEALPRFSEAQMLQRQESLLSQLQASKQPEEIAILIQLMKEWIDDMYRHSYEHRLVALVEFLVERTRADVLFHEEWCVLLRQYLASETSLARWFDRARQGDAVAYSFLVSLCRESVWYGVRECCEHPFPGLWQRQFDLLFSICRRAPVVCREEALAFLLSNLDTVEQALRPHVFALVGCFAVESLEAYVCRCLSLPISSDERRLLVEEAMRWDSPRLREFLYQALLANNWVDEPELEEQVIHYLQRVGMMEPISFLAERVFRRELHLGVRCQAVWMLGGLRSPESLSCLHTVLAAKPLEEEKYGVWPAIRFMALFSLSRFALEDVAGIFQQGKGSSSLLHQLASRYLLGETLS